MLALDFDRGHPSCISVLNNEARTLVLKKTRITICEFFNEEQILSKIKHHTHLIQLIFPFISRYTCITNMDSGQSIT